MGAWYWIGVSVGLGAAAGVLLGGVVARLLLAALLVASVAGAAIGYAVDVWQPGGFGNVVGGIVGGFLAALATVQIVRGALRRGGTTGGTAVIVSGAALGFAALAFVPVLGYLTAVGLPGVAARLRRRAPERYAGLRTLAK